MTGVTTAPTAAAATRVRRVLIVEDEVLIAMVLEDMLGILGHTVVATAATIGEAGTALAAGGIDLVIADVNLGAEPIYPFAERARLAGVALIFATGSHRDTLPPQFAHLPVLEKPYTMAAIEGALEKL